MSALAGLSRRCWGIVPVLVALAAAGCGPRDTSHGFRPGPPWIQSLAFAPDGKALAVGQGKVVTLWDPEAGTETGRLAEVSGGGGILCLAYRHDGGALAVGGVTLPLEDPDPAKQPAGPGKGAGGSLATFNPATRAKQTVFTGHTAQLTAIAFSPDGKLLASAAGDPNPYHLVIEAKLWGADKGTPLADLGGHKKPVSCLAFSPDGKTLVTGGLDSQVKVWDVQTRKERATLDGGGGAFTAVAFAPDGKTLATAEANPPIRLWDTATWKEKATLPGHPLRVTGLALAPSGRILASAAEDGTVYLWDPGTGQRKACLEGHSGRILALAYGADDPTLATGGTDGMVKVWDAAEGKERRTLGPVRPGS